MSRYPILVAKFGEDHPSDAVVCERCHATFDWDPSDGDPYDLCSTHGATSLGECGGQLVFKFHEGMTCPGCGDLAWDLPIFGARTACSRKCALQAEYADSLKESA